MSNVFKKCAMKNLFASTFGMSSLALYRIINVNLTIGGCNFLPINLLKILRKCFLLIYILNVTPRRPPSKKNEHYSPTSELGAVLF